MSARALPLALFVAACGSGVPLPPRGPHPPHVQDFVEVDFPPPPAQIEAITEELPGHPDCVWVDGHYAWQEGRWLWLPGYWAEPTSGCYYAPAVAAWSQIGEARLYYTPPRWYKDDAMSLAGPAATCPAPKTCGS